LAVWNHLHAYTLQREPKILCQCLIITYCTSKDIAITCSMDCCLAVLVQQCPTLPLMLQETPCPEGCRHLHQVEMHHCRKNVSARSIPSKGKSIGTLEGAIDNDLYISSVACKVVQCVVSKKKGSYVISCVLFL